MSLKSCLRVAPLTINYIIRQQSILTLNNPSRVCFEHNLARPVLHVRGLFKDASKSEIKNDDERERVYYGILTPHIRAVKWFSLTTSVCGIAAQPFIIKEVALMHNTFGIVALGSFIGFFTFITPLLLHYITKRYITHLDYIPEKDTYIASTVNFFCMRKETKFTPDDVKVPDVPGMFTTFIAKDKPLFLEARLFEDPNHYIRIMGYDKPMDFKLCETPKKIEDKKF